MRKALVIRADANGRMGTGHVMRCIALGQAWQDAVQSSGFRVQGSVVFICAEIPDALAERVTSEGFDLIRINADLGSPGDLCQTLDVVSGLKSHVLHVPESVIGNRQSSITSPWLVLDGYHFSLGYQRGIRTVGIKLLLIDDYNHLPEYEADILVNQNIGAEEIEYKCNPDCRKLLGTRYVMLRREFRKAQSRRRSGTSKNILVSMGGADPDNATLQVLEALQQLDVPNLRVKAIVGPANRHLESLQQVVDLATFYLRLLTNVKDMPGLMNWADFAISAAGSTCWELAAMGVPFVSVVLAENQERIAKFLADAMHVPSIGWVDSAFKIRCAEILPKYLSIHGRGAVRNPIAGVDRFGVDRILQKPAKECGLDLFKGRLILRPTAASDAELLLEWANDPVTRANSFSTEPISLESHLDWLAGKLNNPNVLMFMLTLDGTPSGHIRYELDEEGDALLSFVVAPEFRGMGIGDRLVELSRKEVVMFWKGCRIKAYTIAANRASAAIFEKRGFARHEAEPNQSKECTLFYWSER